MFSQQEKHIDWMRIGAIFFDSQAAVLTENLCGPLRIPKEGTIAEMLKMNDCCVLNNIKTGIWIADLQLVRCPVCDLDACDDPTYMIRAIPSNVSDNVYCTLLAQSAVHGAFAGYTGFTVGPVNGRQSYIPFHKINEKQNKVLITDRMWARLLSSTNQPSFLSAKDVMEATKGETPPNRLVQNGEEINKDVRN